MKRFACRTACHGAAEFGDGYFDVLQSFGWRILIGFFSVISEIKILEIGFAMNQKAVLVIGTDMPAACP